MYRTKYLRIHVPVFGLYKLCSEPVFLDVAMSGMTPPNVSLHVSDSCLTISQYHIYLNIGRHD